MHRESQALSRCIFLFRRCLRLLRPLSRTFPDILRLGTPIACGGGNGILKKILPAVDIAA